MPPVAGGRFLYLHRELGRRENALGCAGWTMRYGERGEWRVVLRAAAAETLREARRAAAGYGGELLWAAATLSGHSPLGWAVVFGHRVS